ncbi:MAG: NUDIX domain-containing protein [Bergeyella sp.]|nr:NUDIX domain-containing protein [Bergeyella sp.]
MYKVFVNDKKLSIGNFPRAETDKTLPYEETHTLEYAVKLLECSSFQKIHVYGDENKIWKDFKKVYHYIEAAGGVLENLEKEILFIFRSKKWDLPKGKLEKNETPDRAALREIEEETGLGNLIMENFLLNTYHVYTEKNGKKILKNTFWYSLKYEGTQIPKPQTEEGITEAKWIPKKEIRNQIFPNTFKNIQLVLKKAGL